MGEHFEIFSLVNKIGDGNFLIVIKVKGALNTKMPLKRLLFTIMTIYRSTLFPVYQVS